MKKEYIVPSIKVSVYQASELMSARGVIGDNGIGYGGIDDDGELDPSAKDYSVWDDTEE